MEFKVVGVSFENRQDILGQLYQVAHDRQAQQRLTCIELRPEPENQHDPNAVAVWCEFGKLGYIARDCTHLVDPGQNRVSGLRFLGSPTSILGLVIEVQ